MITLAIAAALAWLAQAFVVKTYKIPSGSMEPTLKIGQRIIVNRVGMTINGPYVGEIAVFHPPASAKSQECGPEPHMVSFGGAACSKPVPVEASENFVKRVVAGPGDEIYIAEGHVYRKAAGAKQFVREKDSYIRPCGQGEISVPQAPPLAPKRLVSDCDFPTPIKIPPDHWFMMGDNRGGSDDSRFWGPVPRKWIIGGAFFTYWPPNRIGFL